MSNLTSWYGGALNSDSVAFQAAFLAADLNGLASGSAVMSSTAFNNTVGLDQFLDLSFVGVFAASETVVAGAGMGFWLAILQEDGTTYGDGRLTAGTQAAYAPLLNPIGGFPIQVGTITDFWGSSVLNCIPPRNFRLVAQNNTGFALASSGNSCSISTYRQNTNAS